MQKSIDNLREEFQQHFNQVKSTHDLEGLKVKFFGKKGPVQNLMQVLRDVAPDQRPMAGKQINDLKEWMALQCENLAIQLTAKEEENQLAVLAEYLPVMMERKDVEEIAKNKKSELGIDDSSKKGLLMSALMKDLKGKADGMVVKEVVDSLF